MPRTRPITNDLNLIQATITDAIQKPGRRTFIRIASAGSLAAGTGGLNALLVPQVAKAQQAFGDANFATLTKIARDIFPHDRFDDAPYQAAVAVYGDSAKTDAAQQKLMADGIAAVDAAALQKSGKRYVDMPAEADRVAVLKGLETSQFFVQIRGDLVVSLYNKPAVWKQLGYQGPSADLGSYIRRGFNDQDWVATA